MQSRSIGLVVIILALVALVGTVIVLERGSVEEVRSVAADTLIDTVARTTLPATSPTTSATTTVPSTTSTSTVTTTTMDALPTPVTGADGYVYVPKPSMGPATIGPGGALTKHLAGDIASSFGFGLADVVEAIDAVVLPPEARGNPEGWLAPGTYVGFDSAPAVVQAMVDRRISQLEQRSVPREDWHRLLTAASVIEKETYNQNEKPRVATVLTNRLAGGGPLQMDSIILYPVAEDRIFTTADERSSDQPYNSYFHDGLPPTPISSPDEASLDAFLSPPPGEWFFYVTVDLETGDTRFAVTYGEHLENVTLLRSWLRDNPTP